MNHYLITLRPSRAAFPADATPTEMATVGEHFAYFRTLVAQGRALLVGRTDETTPLGIALILARDDADARAMLAADPAVAGGVMAGQVAPFRLALAGKIEPRDGA